MFCSAVAVANTEEVRKVGDIHPDYAFGRWFIAHFNVALEKLLPGVQVVAEGWPKLGERDFSTHITKVMGAKPDLLVTALWGADYVSFYKQALRFGLFDRMKVCGSIAFGCVPHALGKDHPEGILAGAHSNYHFTHPIGNRWPLNKQFVERYYKRWKEYPNLEAEAAYTGMYFLKTAIERANKLVGGWPDTDAIIGQLEGLSIAAPSGYVSIRREDHRAFKDVVVGFSKNLPDYPFPVWDPNRVMTMAVRNMTAPPNWPKPGQGHNDISGDLQLDPGDLAEGIGLARRMPPARPFGVRYSANDRPRWTGAHGSPVLHADLAGRPHEASAPFVRSPTWTCSPSFG